MLVHHYTDISLDTLHRVVSKVDIADHAPFVWDQNVRDHAAQLNHPHCDVIFITERVPTRDQNNVHGVLFSSLRKNVNFYFSNIRVQLIENKRFLIKELLHTNLKRFKLIYTEFLWLHIQIFKFFSSRSVLRHHV